MCWVTVVDVFPSIICKNNTGLVGVLDGGDVVLYHLLQHLLHFLGYLKVVPLLVVLFTIVPN